MLTSKLGNAFANKKLLSVSLVISLIVAIVVFAIQANMMSLELADKSKTIEQQNQELAQYATTIASQKQEIADKSIQLEKIDKQIDTLSLEIVSKEEELAAKSQQTESLGETLAIQQADLKKLQFQFQNLQTEMGLLQEKIKSNEQYIAELTHQIEIAQQDSRIQISHYSLGVTEDNKGIVFPIEVEIIPFGTGSVSIDVSNVQYEASFQSAVRTAAIVASDYTGKSLSDKDIIIRFVNDFDDSGKLIKIDGPSAGAVITAMIIAGLSDKVLSPSTLVTGTIKPDGSIGNVGSIEDKIDAAIGFGANVMLVPNSQEFRSNQILVIGVSNIDEVMKYLSAS